MLEASDLCDRLTAQFRDVNHLTKTRLALSRLTQGQGNVAQYTARFCSLHMELGEHAPDDNSALFNFV